MELGTVGFVCAPLSPTQSALAANMTTSARKNFIAISCFGGAD